MDGPFKAPRFYGSPNSVPSEGSLPNALKKLRRGVTLLRGQHRQKFSNNEFVKLCNLGLQLRISFLYQSKGPISICFAF